MQTSNTIAIFDAEIETVWNIVTNNKEYQWRSDISRIEVIQEKNQFIEYTKNGFPTFFTITKKEKYRQYEFDMENSNMKGHWIGKFSVTQDGKVKIDFIEQVEMKNKIFNLLAKFYLKSQQKRYVADLVNKIEEVYVVTKTNKLQRNN